jgi:predicted exporter
VIKAVRLQLQNIKRNPSQIVKTTMNNSRSRQLLPAFGFLLLSIVLALASNLEISKGSRLRADILDLLFSDESKSEDARALRDLNRQSARVLFFTFSGDAASDAQDAFLAKIDGQLQLESIEEQLGEEKLSLWFNELYAANALPYSKRWSEVISSKDPAESFSQLLTERMSRVATIVPLQLTDDPFLLAHEFAHEQISKLNSQASTSNQDPNSSGTLILTLAKKYAEQTSPVEIEKIITEALSPGCSMTNTKCEWAGYIKFAASSEIRLTKELGWYSSLAALVTGLTALILFRSIRQILIALLVVGIGFIWGLAATMFTLGSVHLVTLGFGSALMGVSVDYLIHFFAEQLAQPRQNSAWKIRDAVVRPISFGMATSGIVFLVLAFSGFPGLREIAVFSGMGLLGSYLSVVLLVPALSGAAVGRGDSWIFALSNAICGWPKRVRLFNHMATKVFLLITLAIGLPLLDCKDDIRSLQEPEAVLLEEHQRVMGVFGLPLRSTTMMLESKSVKGLLAQANQLKGKLDTRFRF